MQAARQQLEERWERAGSVCCSTTQEISSPRTAFAFFACFQDLFLSLIVWSNLSVNDLGQCMSGLASRCFGKLRNLCKDTLQSGLYNIGSRMMITVTASANTCKFWN